VIFYAEQFDMLGSRRARRHIDCRRTDPPNSSAKRTSFLSKNETQQASQMQQSALNSLAIW
jgi:hypothetical protein